MGSPYVSAKAVRQPYIEPHICNRTIGRQPFVQTHIALLLALLLALLRGSVITPESCQVVLNLYKRFALSGCIG